MLVLILPPETFSFLYSYVGEIIKRETWCSSVHFVAWTLFEGQNIRDIIGWPCTIASPAAVILICIINLYSKFTP